MGGCYAISKSHRAAHLRLLEPKPAMKARRRGTKLESTSSPATPEAERTREDGHEQLQRRRVLLVKLLWSVSEVAELTGLHPQTLYKALDERQLTSSWICGKVLVPRDAIARKFGTDFPALMRAIEHELGPMGTDLRRELEENRGALLKLLWTPAELARLTGLHQQTIYKGIDVKDITSTRIGAKILIPRDPFLKKFQMEVPLLLASLSLDMGEAA